MSKGSPPYRLTADVDGVDWTRVSQVYTDAPLPAPALDRLSPR